MTNLVRALAIGAITFGIDRFSKWAVLAWLDLAEVGKIEIFPPFLNFVMAANFGVNFGLLASDSDLVKVILAGFAVVVSIILVIWAARRSEPWVGVAAGLVIGGALGNAYDRMVLGAVIDFLNMSCCGFDNPYVFNIADIWIFAGVAMIALIGQRDTKAG